MSKLKASVELPQYHVIDPTNLLMCFPLIACLPRNATDKPLPMCAMCLTANVYDLLEAYKDDLQSITFQYKISEYGYSHICSVLHKNVEIRDVLYCSKCALLFRTDGGGSLNNHIQSDRHLAYDVPFFSSIKSHLCELIEHIVRNHSKDEWRDQFKKANFPFLSENTVETLLDVLAKLTEEIVKITIEKAHEATLYIDGWTKKRGYEGVSLSFLLESKVVRVFFKPYGSW